MLISYHAPVVSGERVLGSEGREGREEERPLPPRLIVLGRILNLVAARPKPILGRLVRAGSRRTEKPARGGEERGAAH